MCVSSHHGGGSPTFRVVGGGTYSGLGARVHLTLAGWGGYLPSHVWVGGPTLAGVGGGTYLSRSKMGGTARIGRMRVGTPTRVRYPPHQGRYPPPE